MNEPIAMTDLICVRATGERMQVKVTIGKPYIDADGLWACPVGLDGLHRHLSPMRSDDSLHALCLSILLVRNLLAGVLAEGGRVLLADQDDQDMPMDAYFSAPLPSPRPNPRPDPLGLRGSRHLYAYAEGSPVVLRDPLGLTVEVYCHLVGAGGGFGLHDAAGAAGYKHCFVRVKCDCPEPYDLRLELTGNEGGQGVIPPTAPTFEHYGPLDRVGYTPPDTNSQECSMENCMLNEYNRLGAAGYPYGGYLSGPNSNTFAGRLLGACGVTRVLWPSGVPPYSESPVPFVP